MSQQQQAPPTPIAEAINGYEDLYPRQQDTNDWHVLSLRNNSITAHEVGLDPFSCTCADYNYNQDGVEICDHIAVVLFAADQTLSFEAYAGHHLESLLDRAQSAVRSIEDVRDVAQAAQDATAATAASQPSESDETPAVEDPVGSFEALLRDAGLDPDDFRVWIDDESGSLQVDQTGYLDSDDFETWVDLSDDLELGYNGDDDVNYLESDRFPEVLA
jgi:hypothetical protein